MSADRTVHGYGTDDHGVHYEVVRYDRAGKWYIEFEDGSSRKPVGVTNAARAASHPILGLPGGRLFDAAVKSAL
jgi:hypothetical protein